MKSDAIRLVLDTNVALDLFVYEDAACSSLRLALSNHRTTWVATTAMREELVRVLSYPQIAKRLATSAIPVNAVLAAWDAQTQIVPASPKAPCTCKDIDDQIFIDLAVAHSAFLLSKDADVLCMAKRLAKLGVSVLKSWPVNTPSTVLD